MKKQKTKIGYFIKPLIVSLMALSIGACSGREQPSTAKALIEPCDLILKTEAEEVLKTPLEEALSEDLGPPLGQKICNYFPIQTEGLSEYKARMLQISLLQDAAMDPEVLQNGVSSVGTYEVFYNSRGPEAVDVENVGDKAYLEGSILRFVKNGIYVQVTTSNPVFSISDADTLLASAAARQFASKIAERLP